VAGRRTAGFALLGFWETWMNGPNAITCGAAYMGCDLRGGRAFGAAVAVRGGAQRDGSGAGGIRAVCDMVGAGGPIQAAPQWQVPKRGWAQFRGLMGVLPQRDLISLRRWRKGMGERLFVAGRPGSQQLCRPVWQRGRRPMA
jgi:hypothetical protein